MRHASVRPMRLIFLPLTSLLLAVAGHAAQAETSVFCSQRDPQWQGDTLGTGTSTIGAKGCALASVAMALASSGASVDPRTLNQWLTSHDPSGYANGDELVWSVAADYPGSGLAWGRFDSLTTPGALKASLDRGDTVIARSDRFGGDSHFCIIVRYVNAGTAWSDFVYWDPWDETATERWLGDGWIGAGKSTRVYRPLLSWSMVSVSMPATGAMAYDEQRHRLVFCGNDVDGDGQVETWVWDGERWSRATPASAPASGGSLAMAYDSVNARVVLWGVVSGISETWTWDGETWTRLWRHTYPGGDGWNNWSMAFDSQRGRLVLVGGRRFNHDRYCLSTWEWDGTSWTEAITTPSPPFRAGHAVAYDATRARVVLFGGLHWPSIDDDTWEWDGTTWTQASPTLSPPGRFYHAMAFDLLRQRVVLSGGVSSSWNTLGDTWEWDGTDWTQVTAATPPAARRSHSMAYDSVNGRMVLYGGTDSDTRSLGDTWTWDGAAWTRISTPTAPPAEGPYTSMVCDAAHGHVILFLREDVWTWDGRTWTRTSPGDSLEADAWRTESTAYDTARGRAVYVDARGSTWEWDGADWWLAAGANPDLAFNCAVAYDERRRRTVLYAYAYSWARSTYEWDGTRWAAVAGYWSSPVVENPSMAFDEVRGSVLLFGSRWGQPETWEWNGIEWRRLSPEHSPTARRGQAMVHDPGRRRIVLLGGTDAGYFNFFNDTWEWDGTDWTQRRWSNPPPPRLGSVMTYDTTRGRLLLFGGYSPSGTLPGALWELSGLAPSAPDAAAITFRQNPPGTSDTITGGVGSVRGGSTVRVYADEALTQLIGTVVASADGSFGPYDIGDNLYSTLYITATDAEGRGSEATILLNDITPPTVAITTPTAGAEWTSTQFLLAIAGTASDDQGIARIAWSNASTDEAGDASGTTSWTASVRLVLGINMLSMIAQDAAGNSATATLAVTATDGTRVIALGGGRGARGWVQVKSGGAGGYGALGWAQLPWTGHNTADGSVHVALGHLDREAGCHLVVGTNRGGYLAVMRLDGSSASLVRWVRVPWLAYDLAAGVTWPTCADVDGDGVDGLIVGLGPYPLSGGWAVVLDDLDHDCRTLRWLRLSSSAYNQSSGETRVAAGDVDGDGHAEVVLATGVAPLVGGFAEVFDDATAGFGRLATIRWPGAAFVARSGELWPAVGDLDGDGRAETLLGSGRSGGGRVCVFADAAGGFAIDRALTFPWSVYNAAQGEVRVACGDVNGDPAAEVLCAQGTWPQAGGWSYLWDDGGTGFAGLRWVRYDWPAYDASNGGLYPAIGGIR